MKKILIASSCAILLCFTSCASKQAPESESQIEAPETETSEVAITSILIFHLRKLLKT